MAEKDTIQSMFLYELSQSGLPFVFKGGTSLSKVYRLIDRFSEDIDLSMSRRPTQSERAKSKECIMDVATMLGLSLTSPEEIKSRYDYNRYVFQYDSMFAEIPLELIVETSYYQAVYPVEQRSVGSFIGAFCHDRGISLPIPFEAEQTVMAVQALERTLVDKVFAVCDYKIQNMPDRNSRHLYDISKLMERIALDDKLDTLSDAVREDRMCWKNHPSAQLRYCITEILREIVQSGFYESDYRNVTQKLLYEAIPYEDVVKKGIAKIIETDVFEYKKNIQSL